MVKTISCFSINLASKFRHVLHFLLGNGSQTSLTLIEIWTM
uniref:Uncharacterized protein n=1 Tax=Nelumbo nucifera TaxID=4432 RepID=A0A822ZF34_NELNU|nr:TPA_asm: hypothetical protein HUJ06_001403 [Nelumbo nucifera]